MHMPVFCHNILFVSGDLESLNKLKQKAEGVDFWDHRNYNDFNLNNFLPVPKDLKDERSIRQWQIANWGCREGALRSKATPDFEHKELDYAIITIEYPPVKVFEVVSAMFPTLKFELIFKVPNRGTNGSFIFEKGERK